MSRPQPDADLAARPPPPGELPVQRDTTKETRRRTSLEPPAGAPPPLPPRDGPPPGPAPAAGPPPGPPPAAVSATDPSPAAAVGPPPGPPPAAVSATALPPGPPPAAVSATALPPGPPPAPVSATELPTGPPPQLPPRRPSGTDPDQGQDQRPVVARIGSISDDLMVSRLSGQFPNTDAPTRRAVRRSVVATQPDPRAEAARAEVAAARERVETSRSAAEAAAAALAEAEAAKRRCDAEADAAVTALAAALKRQEELAAQLTLELVAENDETEDTEETEQQDETPDPRRLSAIIRTKQSDRRAELSQQLLESERAYVGSLRALMRLYVTPLEESQHPMASAPEVAVLFSSLRQILTLNAKLLADLELRRHQQEKQQQYAPETDPPRHLSSIGAVFVHYAPLLRLYTGYAAAFDEAVTTMFERRKRNDRMSTAAFVEAVATANPEQPSLEEFMTLPVSRIPAYKKTLQDLLKITPLDDASYAPLQAACESVRVAAASVADSVRRRENREQIIALQREFGGNVSLLTPGRLFLKDGPLLKVSRKGPQAVYAHLFNDVLMYSDALPGGGYRLRRTVDLATAAVVPLPPGYCASGLFHESRRLDPTWGFQITSVPKSFCVFADSAAECGEWSEAIRAAIAGAAATSGDPAAAAAAAAATAEVAAAPPPNRRGSVADVSIAPVWAPDSAAAGCSLCDSRWTLVNRRHHCRRCGQVVCGSCSACSWLLLHISAKPVRVCDECVRVLRTVRLAADTWLARLTRHSGWLHRKIGHRWSRHWFELRWPNKLVQLSGPPPSRGESDETQRSTLDALSLAGAEVVHAVHKESKHPFRFHVHLPGGEAEVMLYAASREDESRWVTEMNEVATSTSSAPSSSAPAAAPAAPAVAAEPPQGADRQLWLRGRVLGEIVVTERTYVTGLSEFIESVAQPLLLQHQQAMAGDGGRSRLSVTGQNIARRLSTLRSSLAPQDAPVGTVGSRRASAAGGGPRAPARALDGVLAAFFNAVQQIYTLHAQLLATLSGALEQQSSSSSDDCQVGEIFSQYAPLFEIYSTYAANHEGAMSAVQRPLFQQQLADAVAPEAAQQLQSFMILPIQRIPRYKLLLQELLKRTPAAHPDQAALRDAVERVNEAAHTINRFVRDRDNKAKLQALQEAFGVQLVAEGRFFVREGPLAKLCRRQQRKEYHFLLCNDALVYGKPTSATAYKFHRSIDLRACRVTAADDASFTVVSPSKTFTVVAPSPAERDEWVADIVDAITSVSGVDSPGVGYPGPAPADEDSD